VMPYGRTKQSGGHTQQGDQNASQYLSIQA